MKNAKSVTEKVQQIAYLMEDGLFETTKHIIAKLRIKQKEIKAAITEQTKDIMQHHKAESSGKKKKAETPAHAKLAKKYKKLLRENADMRQAFERIDDQIRFLNDWFKKANLTMTPKSLQRLQQRLAKHIFSSQVIKKSGKSHLPNLKKMSIHAICNQYDDTFESELETDDDDDGDAAAAEQVVIKVNTESLRLGAIPQNINFSIRDKIIDVEGNEDEDDMQEEEDEVSEDEDDEDGDDDNLSQQLADLEDDDQEDEAAIEAAKALKRKKARQKKKAALLKKKRERDSRSNKQGGSARKKAKTPKNKKIKKKKKSSAAAEESEPEMSD